MSSGFDRDGLLGEILLERSQECIKRQYYDQRWIKHYFIKSETSRASMTLLSIYRILHKQPRDTSGNRLLSLPASE
jgi:hypothetical protein